MSNKEKKYARRLERRLYQQLETKRFSTALNCMKALHKRDSVMAVECWSTYGPRDTSAVDYMGCVSADEVETLIASDLAKRQAIEEHVAKEREAEAAA